MRIGIISNTDSFIPFTYTLVTQQLQVYTFYSCSKDDFINQKVNAFITQNQLPFVEEKDIKNDLYLWLQNGKYDVCFILGYGYLIDLNRLNGCHTQLFNIHFGPLPSFKGPVPVFWQLKGGVDNIGLAIHQLSSKFDDGPVVWMKETRNLPHYNYQTANQVLSQLSVEGVFFILRLLINKLPLPVINGNNTIAAYQKRPVLKDVLIDWKKMNSLEICNLIRACNPWNKGGLSFFKRQEIKLMDAVIAGEADHSNQNLPGTILENEEKLHIYCRDGKVINVNMLFYNESFIPAYQHKNWGLVKGEQLG